MRRTIFDDVQAIEAQQDVDEFVFIHAKARDNVAKLPIVHEQVSHNQQLGLGNESKLLRLAQVGYQVQSFGPLHQVIQCKAEGCANLIEPTQGEVSPAQI